MTLYQLVYLRNQLRRAFDSSVIAEEINKNYNRLLVVAEDKESDVEPELKDKIIAYNGSIQQLTEIPYELKKIYKTIWEIKQIWVLKGALARAPFVDQTQSMNIFMAEPDYQRLTSAHFWGWSNKLKTGMYYLRSKPAINPTKFTIDPNMEKNINMESENPCINCSS